MIVGGQRNLESGKKADKNVKRLETYEQRDGKRPWAGSEWVELLGLLAGCPYPSPPPTHSIVKFGEVLGPSEVITRLNTKTEL